MIYRLKRDNIYKKYQNDVRKEIRFCICWCIFFVKRLNLLTIMHLYVLIVKGQFSFHSQRVEWQRAMTKNVQTAAQLHSLHMLAKWYSKSFKLGLLASCGTCMEFKKQQLESDMEPWTGSKLGKEYIKAVNCHSGYLTYMWNTPCKIPG